MDPNNIIRFSELYWEQMQTLVHSRDELIAEGYRMEGFSMEEIGGLRRCRDCGCRLKEKTNKNKNKNKNKKKNKNKNKPRKVSQQRDLLTGDDGSEFDTSRIYYEVPELKELDEDMKQAGLFEPDADADEKVPDDDDRDDDDQGDDDQGEGGSAGHHHHGREDSTDSQDGGILLIEGVVEEEEDKDDPNKEKEKEKKAKCRFHPGTVVSKHFTCCNGFVMGQGCVEHVTHTPRTYQPGELEQDWTLYATPSVSGETRRQQHRRAVALDCEMGISFTGESELIRVSVVDYFSGERLIDGLVYPRVGMQHFNTRYSGVTRGMMETARRRGEVMAGRDDARQAVWRFVGRDTVVVVHGGKADLMALRWIHGRVIDTFLVEGRRINRQGGEKRSLKYLTEVMLGRRIQGGCHDSVEDAMAARELVHWYVENGV